MGRRVRRMVTAFLRSSRLVIVRSAKNSTTRRLVLCSSGEEVGQPRVGNAWGACCAVDVISRIVKRAFVSLCIAALVAVSLEATGGGCFVQSTGPGRQAREARSADLLVQTLVKINRGQPRETRDGDVYVSRG